MNEWSNGGLTLTGESEVLVEKYNTVWVEGWKMNE